MRYIIADTETDGLVNPRACEVAWIEIDENLEVLSEFESILDPEVPICCSAAGIHGLRNEDVIGKPTIEEIVFPEGEICLIGHNIKFDRQMLDPHMNVVAQCDTLILARRMLPDAPDHKLSTLGCYCDLQKQLSHRALYDCRYVLGLIEYLMEGTGWGLIELINYSNTPQIVEFITFGKHKGLPMRSVPKSYLKWMAGEDFDIDIRFTLAKMGYL